MYCKHAFLRDMQPQSAASGVLHVSTKEDSCKMSPPIQKSRKSTANILPCRIHKTSPVSATERYWSVQEQGGGANVNNMNKVAYFRGRKLLGKEIKIEDDYRGMSDN